MIDINTTYHYNISNVDEYLGISVTSRISLIILTTLIVITGLCGNAVVLYGSIKCKAIDMDRISLFLIECLAGADFLLALIIYIPILDTLISNKWGFGDRICFIIRLIDGVLTKFETLLTAAISCYRLYYVLTHGMVTQIQIIYVRAFIIFLSLIPCSNVLILTISQSIIYFNPHCMCCWATLHDPVGTISMRFSMILILLPMGIILIANIALLIIANKHLKNITGHGTKTVPRKALITTSCICWSFVISWIPDLFCWIINKEPRFLITFGKYMMALNVVINPVIYSITNNKFRSFLKRLFSKKLTVVGSRLDSVRSLRSPRTSEYTNSKSV